MGSNHRRLSRRFYSPSLLVEAGAAGQRLRRSRRDCGPPPSAMRPWSPGSGATESTDGRGKPTDEGGRSGYTDRPPGFSPLTWHFMDTLDDDSVSLQLQPPPVTGGGIYGLGHRT